MRDAGRDIAFLCRMMSKDYVVQQQVRYRGFQLYLCEGSYLGV